LYELSVGWHYNLTPASLWDVKVGAALAYQYLETALETASQSVSGKVKEHLFLPLLNATLSYHMYSVRAFETQSRVFLMGTPGIT